MLNIVTWLWGTKWPPIYVERLAAGLKRNLKQNYRFILVTDQDSPEGPDVVAAINEADRSLIERPGCLIRMRMFDAGWQEHLGIERGDRVVNIDVDSVITGELDPLFDRRDEFRIMQGFNTTNPCPFNGSLWMFRAGERHDVWNDFSLENYRARGIPFHAFPDDQGWLHHKFPNAAAYTTAHGVFAMKKAGWGGDGRRVLPNGARLVAFPGRDPAKYDGVPWVVKHWIGRAD